MFGASTLLFLASFISGDVEASPTQYYYAQLPDKEGSIRSIRIEKNYTYFADFGVPHKDMSTDSFYCLDSSGLIFSAPKESLATGESWICADQKYTYTTDSIIFFVEGSVKVKITYGEDKTLTYYSPETGVMGMKVMGHDVIWHLSSEDGLFGEAWRAEHE